MIVCLKEGPAGQGVWTIIIPAIMEIMVFLQHLVLQHHGSETIPDYVIFQDPQKGEKEKLGLEWNTKRVSLLSSAQHNEDVPTDQTEMANSGNVNSGVANYELSTPSWARNFRVSIKEWKTLGGTGTFCQK